MGSNPSASSGAQSRYSVLGTQYSAGGYAPGGPKYPDLSHPANNVAAMVTDTDKAADRLSERDRRVLDFEGSWWLYPQPKDRAIPEYLGMSATRYYQALRRLMDDDTALAYAPMTVRRLQRMRRDRTAQIAARVRGRDGTS